MSQFHTLDDYVEWLNTAIKRPLSDYDVIIGHSMGGLVALKAAMYSKISHIILIETFLEPPTPFFQNLLYPSNEQGLSFEIEDMLKGEKKYYSQKLGKAINTISMSHVLKDVDSRIHLIYGDRGVNDLEEVILNLGLPAFDSKMDISTVRNSCHFPMLENSTELDYLIQNIVTKWFE